MSVSLHHSYTILVLLLRCKTVRVLALQLVYMLVLCLFHHIISYYQAVRFKVQDPSSWYITAVSVSVYI